MDLSTNVASITLAANSVIDVVAGGVDQAITLADVTGDFDLTLTGDSASAVGLNAVDVDALAVTGTLTLMTTSLWMTVWIYQPMWPQLLWLQIV